MHTASAAECLHNNIASEATTAKMHILVSSLLLLVRLVWSTAQEDDLRRLKHAQAEQKQLSAALDELRADLVHLRQRYGILFASTTVQRHKQAEWQRDTTARLESMAGERRLSTAISSHRRLSSGACVDPSGPQLAVDGVCSCTSGLLVEGRNLTKELDYLLRAIVPTASPLTSISTSAFAECRGNITFTEKWEFDTDYASDWEHFTVDNEEYLAVANSQKGSSLLAQSMIYHYNITAKKFDAYQVIDTMGAADWEHFTVDNDHYLAMANARNDTSWGPTVSVIYRFNNGTATFDEYQEVNITGAYDWEHLAVGNDHYLAVAKYRSGSSYQTPSVVYRFNHTSAKFEEYQEIDTIGAYDWESFTVDSVHYLAVANAYHPDQVKSVIYRFNNVTAKFEEHQKVESHSATGWEHFTVENDDYLAIANHVNGSHLTTTKSVIYHYNNATSKFDAHQEIDTKGAHDWEHFVVDNVHYLAVANYRFASSYQTKSVIYRFNNATAKFEEHQEIDTNGASDWEYFAVDNKLYLAIANYYGGTSSVYQATCD